MRQARQLLEWQAQESEKNHKWRIAELVIRGFVIPVLIIAATIFAAFIQLYLCTDIHP